MKTDKATLFYVYNNIVGRKNMNHIKTDGPMVYNRQQTKMKKVLKAMGLLALMMTVVLAVSAFTTQKDVQSQSEKSCKVTVKYANGDLAESVTVTAYYKRGTYHDFKTDDNGVVRLTWDDSYITHLYVKGDKYEVYYSDGKSYTLTLKKKHKYD